MIAALGVNIELLFSLVFGLGAVFAALAGLMAAPTHLGEDRHGRRHPDPGLRRHRHRRHRLDQRRASSPPWWSGQIDIVGRAFLPDFLKTFMSPPPPRAPRRRSRQVLIYILMAGVLVWRPTGLFGQRA